MRYLVLVIPNIAIYTCDLDYKILVLLYDADYNFFFRDEAV